VLFNSYQFLFAFLPAALLGFFGIARYGRALAGLWLFGASLFFYGWWNPAYVGLLLGSILFNFAIGRALVREHSAERHARRRVVLVVGVAANLCLLAYYKYANFFVTNAAALLENRWHLDPIVLPLGISFFTFTQIAFLVDAYRGEVKEANFIHYGLFVTYFPHLIAGPVLHHKEMMPQFGQPATYQVRWENFSVGLTMFAIGLIKKVVLADGVAPFATPVFDAAARGANLTFFEAWGGALAYTFQLYFDFSGYSDMAIGLSRLFGVRLPLNFDSPYKAVNIIEFWRRWHITLSRFLRDYLYFALGGNRKGGARRYANLLATMILGGLWHGAGWTFVAWGTLHGTFLVINHAWHGLRRALGYPAGGASRVGRFVSMTITFLVVVVAWVFFRASDLNAALNMVGAMIGSNGVALPGGLQELLHWRMVRAMTSIGVVFGSLPTVPGYQPLAAWIIALWSLAWFAPNSQQLLANYRPALEQVVTAGPLRWRPSAFWLTCVAGGLLYAVVTMGGKVSEFLYFQF
jgi:D-alanyl-lipoteichoic acid acyltransferase DltB (MBOAT superfamily)